MQVRVLSGRPRFCARGPKDGHLSSKQIHASSSLAEHTNLSPGGGLGTGVHLKLEKRFLNQWWGRFMKKRSAYRVAKM